MAKRAQFRLISSARAATAIARLGSGTRVLSGVFGFATVIAILGRANRKLIGVVLNELNPTAVHRQRDKQHA
jgi:hypothetical protein